jgi:hypothetical protein
MALLRAQEVSSLYAARALGQIYKVYMSNISGARPRTSGASKGAVAGQGLLVPTGKAVARSNQNPLPAMQSNKACTHMSELKSGDVSPGACAAVPYPPVSRRPGWGWGRPSSSPV